MTCTTYLYDCEYIAIDARMCMYAYKCSITWKYVLDGTFRMLVCFSGMDMSFCKCNYVSVYNCEKIIGVCIFCCSYPTDTDKLMLAKQTGLSRNQVSTSDIFSFVFFFLVFSSA